MSDSKTLGTSELSTALNGDDPILAISVLKKFIKIVRKERYVSLINCNDTSVGGVTSDPISSQNQIQSATLLSEDDDDHSELREDDEDNPFFPPSSKKEEEWKQDSKSYNVPFVGTSTPRGPSGTVVPNHWPTGFLSAYLNQSINASDLLGNANLEKCCLIAPHGSFHRTLLKSGAVGKIRSQLLERLYVEALGELVTCGIRQEIFKKALRLECWFRNCRIRDGEGRANESQKQQHPQQEYSHVISTVMKDRFSYLLNILNEQMGDGKTSSHTKASPISCAVLITLSNLASSSMGAAREVARGLDESLREGVLWLLMRHQTLSMKSKSGKLVKKRKREQENDINDEPDDNIQNRDSREIMETEEEDIISLKISEMHSTKSITETRTACLQLATSLLEANDSTVASYVTSSGSKERKVSPGIVYLALRSGLSSEYFDVSKNSDQLGGDAFGKNERDDYLWAVYRLLRAVRTRLLISIRKFVFQDNAPHGNYDVNKTMTASTSSPDSYIGTNAALLNNRTLCDLFNGEALDRICQISHLAPPLNDYTSITKRIDEGNDQNDENTVVANEIIPMSTLQKVARESQYLLCIFLYSKSRSPFLQHIYQCHNSNTSESLTASYTHQLTKCLQNLAITSKSNQATHSFIVKCLRNTPMLVPSLFRSINVIDPKPTFTSLAFLVLISSLIRDGPSVWSCLGSCYKHNDSSGHINAVRMKRVISFRGDQMAVYVLPKNLTKSILTKTIQSTNHLLVKMGLEMIAAVLQRLGKLLDDVKANSMMTHKDVASGSDLNGFLNAVVDGVRRRLPEIQALLAVRSKFDPFAINSSSSEDDRNAICYPLLLKHSMITMHLCHVLQLYASIFPAAIQSLQFDWVKLLPDNPKKLFVVNLSLQYRLLKTILVIYMSHEEDKIAHSKTNQASSKTFIMLLRILVKTHSLSIYSLTREIAVKTMLRIIQSSIGQPPSAEHLNSLEYETSLWIDGVTEENIPTLSKLIGAVSQVSVQHTILTFQAWQDAFPCEPIKHPFLSPLLSTALVGISSKPSSFGDNFIGYICKLTTKMMLYQLNPLPLAVVVNYICSRGNITGNTEDSETNSSLLILQQYARSLIDSKTGVVEMSLLPKLHRLTLNLFGRNNFHSILTSMVQESPALMIDETRSEDEYDFINPKMDRSISMQIVRHCTHFFVHSNIKMQEKQFAGIHKIYRKSLVILQGNDEVLSALRYLECVPNAQKNNSLKSAISFLITTSSFVLNKKSSHSKNSLLISYVNHIVSSVENAIQRIEDVTTLLDENNLKMLFILTIAAVKQVPSMIAEGTLEKILNLCIKIQDEADASRNCAKIAKAPFALLLKILQSTIGLPRQEKISPDYPIQATFDLWKNLVQMSYTRDKLFMTLCSALENIMTGVLNYSEHNGITSSTLIANIRKTPQTPRYIIDLALKKMEEMNKDRYDNGYLFEKYNQRYKFIQSLFLHDPSIFSGPILDHLLDASADFISLNTSCWDELISALTSNLGLHYNASPHHILNLGKIIVQRACYLLPLDFSKNKYCESSFQHIIHGLRSLLLRGQIEDESIEIFWVKIGQFFESTMNESRRYLPTKKEDILFGFLCAISSKSIENDGADVSSSKKKMIALSFIRLCNILPKCLRRSFQDEDRKSKIDDLLFSSISILKVSSLFDVSVFSSRISSVKACIISCLKHGVSNRGSAKSAALCLKVVRSLLTISSTSEDIHKLLQNELFVPSQIHAMIVSHSNFRSLAKAKNDNTRYELIALLVCCVSLAKGEINVEKDALAALLNGYNAGLSKADCLLRRLIYLYDNISPILFLYELRWDDLQREHDIKQPISFMGNVDVERNIFHGQQWEWLIEGFELRRVRQTLAQFPLTERLKPAPDKEIEPWEYERGASQPDNFHEKEELYDDNCDDISTSTLEKDTNQGEGDNQFLPKRRDGNHEKHVSPLNTEMTESGHDERYSPGFLMPLLLGALEASAFKMKQNSDLSNNTSKNIAHLNDINIQCPVENKSNKSDRVSNSWIEYEEACRERYSNVAFRLAQKGAISFALASLSSRCPDLRRIAVAVLGFFLRALQMKESQNLASWRERPQLALILNSIQRGLAVRRAIQATRQQNESGTKSNLHLQFVPMLPAVSAIFLARAALILAKSGDAMYSPINKFFLRLEHHHGAYVDCFSLPAFISLYCSSSNDVGQARRERLWALQLLKDGTVDDFCYKIAARRHVPELLLTSFENLANREEAGSNEMESILILQTIQCLLSNGGRPSIYHLVSTIGLVSWMRGIIENGSHKVSLPSDLLRSQFLMTIQITLHGILHIEKENDRNSFSTKPLNTITLARPVLEMYLDTANTDKVTSASSSSSLSVVCEILLSIVQIEKMIHSTTDTGYVPSSIYHCGISLNAAQTLLETTKGVPYLYDKAVGSLCFLPLSIKDNEGLSALKFSESIVSYILNSSNNHFVPDTSIYLDIMKRVNFLLNAFKNCINDNKDIVDMVLGAKRKVVKCAGGTREWIKCISSLSDEGLWKNNSWKEKHMQLLRKILECQETQ